jgi:hypothetical protein
VKKLAYTFSVVRCLHDPTVGKMLNIGVVLRATHTTYVGVKFDHHYERLSSAFANFDGDHQQASRQ